MNNNHHQRINIKICITLGKYFAETRIIPENAYGDQRLGRARCCYEWFAHAVKTAGCQLMTAHLQDVRRRQLPKSIKSCGPVDVLIVGEIAGDRNISVEPCHEMSVEKFGIQRVAAKFVHVTRSETQSRRIVRPRK